MGERAGLWKVVSIVLAAGVPAACPGQSEVTARHPRLGRVSDAAGEPLGGAKVTIVSMAAFPDADPADVVTTTTDDAGRFRVLLEPNRLHTAWAVAPGGLVSERLVVPTGSIDIRLQAADRVPPRQFVVKGVAAWQDLGPLAVEIAILRGEPLTVRGELDAAGCIDLPPLPDLACKVRVFAAGHLVHATDRAQSVRAPLLLAAPRHRLARVIDDRQRPVPGATLYRLHKTWNEMPGPFSGHGTSMRYHVATTDAAGTARLLFAAGDAPLFVASAPGFAETISGLQGRPTTEGQQLPEWVSLAGVLPFRLRAQPEQPIAVRLPDRQAPPAIQVCGFVRWQFTVEDSVRTWDTARPPIVDGRLLLPGWSNTWIPKAVAIANRLPPLPPDDPFHRLARPTTMVLPLSALDDPQGLDLRRIVPLRLQVIDATNGPAIHAQVVCVPATPDGYLELDYATSGVCDHAGRIVLPVMPGTWFVAAIGERSWTTASWHVHAGLAMQELRLQPLDCMRLRVVDATGKPRAGLRIEENGGSWNPGPSPEEELRREVAARLSEWAFDNAVTDQHGHVDLWFAADPRTNVRFRVRVKGQRVTGRLTAGEQRVDIVLK